MANSKSKQIRKRMTRAQKARARAKRRKKAAKAKMTRKPEREKGSAQHN